MSINKAEDDLRLRIYNDISQLKRDMRELKNRQPIGMSSLSSLITSDSVYSILLNPGDYVVHGWQFTGAAHVLFQSEFGATFYINNDLNGSYLWPNGASITADLRLFERAITFDVLQSDMTGSGAKLYWVTMKNTGTAAKTVYAHGQLVFPAGILS